MDISLTYGVASAPKFPSLGSSGGSRPSDPTSEVPQISDQV